MHIDLNSQWRWEFSRIMDILTVYHKAIAQNIANTNTPGYIRHTVDFSAELNKVLSGEERSAMNVSPGVGMGINGNEIGIRSKIEIVEDHSQPRRADGNNVTLEKEMVDLSQIAQLYSMLSRLTAKDIKLAHYVISGGRG